VERWHRYIVHPQRVQLYPAWRKVAVAVAVLSCFEYPDGAASCGLLRWWDSGRGIALLLWLIDWGASIEETASNCFEECRDFGAAHRLMGKLDAVGLGSDGVGE
jgi:hypothetical protein